MSKVKLGDKWFEADKANRLIAERLGYTTRLVEEVRQDYGNVFALVNPDGEDVEVSDGNLFDVENHAWIGVPDWAGSIDAALDLPLRGEARWAIEMPDGFVCGVVSIREFEDKGSPAPVDKGDFMEVRPGSGKEEIAPTMCSLWWAHMDQVEQEEPTGE